MKMVTGEEKAKHMEEVEWPCYLDEYEKLLLLMNTPRVVIDNGVFPNATLVTMDSSRKRRILFEAVQVLSDLNLIISKAYFSCDGGWFMDVFHVTDQFGGKLTDKRAISFIEETLESAGEQRKTDINRDLKVLELSGADRPGLLSEVFAVLSDLHCAVPEARVWTHNGLFAAVLFVSDENETQRMSCVQSRLHHIVRGRTEITSVAFADIERRLHQMMQADRDFERDSSSPPAVSVQSLAERGYSVVTVQCPDRSKLLFDIVCALTDMEYVVFHGTVRTVGDRAHQEFYIRHSDGSPISSEAERQRVMQCLQAATERRAQGFIRLELCAVEQRGILSEVTRIFRENGLLVKRAEVSTKGKLTSNVFYITDFTGGVPSSDTLASVRRRLGTGCLTVKEEQLSRFCEEVCEAERRNSSGGLGLLSLGGFLIRNLCNLGLIRPCS